MFSKEWIEENCPNTDNEREFDKCYFLVKDIVEGFGLKKIYDTITYKRYDNYKKNIH